METTSAWWHDGSSCESLGVAPWCSCKSVGMLSLDLSVLLLTSLFVHINSAKFSDVLPDPPAWCLWNFFTGPSRQAHAVTVRSMCPPLVLPRCFE